MTGEGEGDGKQEYYEEMYHATVEGVYFTASEADYS